ncbi:M1-specific T cell receptor alpha chain [Morone saxatilis]|uniref:M1-specific T cell receptor alpha chain n=1 Tax=Morone saxatilis TaxID=34816 RepID=UPI0015E2224E|nr:M1-specific T cell receptor alpha chain [Morone saxatilis]
MSYSVKQQGGSKMYFGSGTKLTVESEEKYEPSYYKVGNDSNAACLATGFSQYNAAISRGDNLFNTTNAILISGDKLYNQVALLSGKEGKCELVEKTEEKCEDTIEPDPMVNLMALTIIGLRLLFLKTIVFNVLMTFRLWISQ